MIDGPRLPPASGRVQSLVVLLHGYGSNGADLISLAPYWRRVLPDTQFVAPDAPGLVPMTAEGRQWFPLSRLDPRELDRGVAAGAIELNRFLDAELTRYRLPPERLALVGFSQGTMMALEVGPRRAGLAGIVGYSGALAGPERLAAEARCRPPVLLIHGDSDDVVPPTALFAAGQGLAAAGFGVEWRLAPDLPHSIDEEGILRGGEFLSRVFHGAAS